MDKGLAVEGDIMINWDDYENFEEKEFTCTYTQRCEMRKDFMDKLQALRTAYGQPLKITSGFRDPRHPIEAQKNVAGVHTRGIACDIACNGSEAYQIVKLAFNLGFTGIGVSQSGKSRFIHLDIFEPSPRPNMWSY